MVQSTREMDISNAVECSKSVFGTRCQFLCKSDYKQVTKHDWVECRLDGTGGMHWTNGDEYPRCESKY